VAKTSNNLNFLKDLQLFIELKNIKYNLIYLTGFLSKPTKEKGE
jgi:hypothetical protein